MTRSTLKATTALTVTLALLQPAPVTARALAAGLRPAPAPGAMSVAPSRAPDAQEWRVQTCEEDPTLPDCVLPDGTVPAEPGAEGTTEPAAEGAVEPAPDAGAEPTPEAVIEAVPEGAPDAAPEVAAEPAPDTAVESPPDVVVEPAPEAVIEAEPTPEAAPAPEAVPEAEPAPEPQPEVAVEPAPEAPVEAAPAEEAAEPAPAPEPAPEPAAPEAEAAPAEAPAAEDGAQATGSEPVAEPAPEAAPEPVTTEAAPVEPAPAEAAPEAATAEPETPEAPAAEEPPAAEVVAEPVPEPVAEPLPEPTPEQAEVLETLMETPEVAEAVETLSNTVAPEAAATGADAAAAAAVAGEAPAAATDTVTRTLSAEESRSATQDFATAVTTAMPTQVEEDDDDGLSDLEKAGLLALGAVAVGMLLGNNRVVANSGDRVVVDRGNGDLSIWKDDDAILRAPGVVETTQRYDDGSTLTRLERPDGSQIITVRDATGRVLRRDRVNVDGSRVQIIDDTRAYAPVDVSQLPRPRVQELSFREGMDPALVRALLAEAEPTGLGRTFSLAQVRDTRELRVLAPELLSDPITFATASAAIRPEEAGKLLRIGEVMSDMIADNPREVFLIEGHTDAVGGAAYNLALSDRRAESVALALTEFFGVPPENMVVQGYGERFLKVNTQADEPANRRVALRRITSLVGDY
jgi:outer membrane protein OmpA-like peptidoglycan-associated protein